MANVIYNGYKAKIGTIDWSDTNNTFKVVLLKDTYTPDIDAHKFESDLDLANNEVSGTGYTAGGATLANNTITEDDTNDLAKYDCDDVTWTNASFTTRGAAIFKDTGTDTTSPLIAYLDFGGNQTVEGADYTISFSADGVFTLA